MKNMLDSLWRAVAYCLYPPVIILSLAPLATLVLAVFAFAYWGWQPSVAAMQSWLQGSALEAAVLRGLGWLNLADYLHFLPRLLVLCVAIPAILIACLLVVTWLSTPALMHIVAQRRFPTLEKKHGGALLASAFWSVGYTLLALLIMLASLPLWLLPPLGLVIPSLIGGWLVAKLLPYDVLAEHASAQERRTLTQRHRFTLLGMGIITGLLGSAPGLLLASGALAIGLFFILAPIALWLYTLVFVFSTLWFGHFCLRALELLRAEKAPHGGASTFAADAGTPPAPAHAAPTLTLPNNTPPHDEH